MKIIGISEEMFERFCEKLTPQQYAAGGNLTARCFYLYAQQALLVVTDDLSIGTLEDSDTVKTFKELGVAVKGCKTTPIIQGFDFSMFDYGAVSEGMREEIRDFALDVVRGVTEDESVDAPNVADRRYEDFTERARRVLFFSRYEARVTNSQYVTPEHLFLGLLREDRQLIDRACGMGVAQEAGKRLREIYSTSKVPGGDLDAKYDDPMMNQRSRNVLVYARQEARGVGENEKVDSIHIALSFIEGAPAEVWHPATGVGLIADIVFHYGITRSKLLSARKGKSHEPTQTA